MNPPYEYRNLPWVENSAGIKSGRLLVSMEYTEEARLDFYNYEGAKLPAYLLYIVLRMALGEGWVGKLERFHQSRKSKWKVETLGDKEYRLYCLEAGEPVCSSAITIDGGQINTFSIHLKDAAPLLKKILEDYTPIFLPRFKNYRYTYFFPNYYPFTIQNIRLQELPGPIQKQREETQRIIVAKETFFSDSLAAGEKSGIMETVEALKCLEVLLA